VSVPPNITIRFPERTRHSRLAGQMYAPLTPLDRIAVAKSLKMPGTGVLERTVLFDTL
jgi:hypothetical protein